MFLFWYNLFSIISVVLFNEGTQEILEEPIEKKTE